MIIFNSYEGMEKAICEIAHPRDSVDIHYHNNLHGWYWKNGFYDGTVISFPVLACWVFSSGSCHDYIDMFLIDIEIEDGKVIVAEELEIKA